MTLAPAAEVVRGVARQRGPYVGLVPYDEGDSAFFFGRSTESAIVAMNLRTARLTILYGPSGVGKSSLLMAGAVHALRREASAGGAERPFAVCVFRSWRDDPVRGLEEAARDVLADLAGPEPLPDPAATLTGTLRAWTSVTGTLLVVLDQFEEYFQYHPNDGDDERLVGFAAELARIVNDPSLRVHVIVSIREDAWAKLDLFEGHVPGLFANYVRIDHLGLPAAREAIEGPVEAWNDALDDGGQPYEIEPALVEAVLAATAGGGLALAADAEMPTAESLRDRVEAPFLQLVLERLWRETAEAGEHTLTLARLEALGGAARIVENHLLEALGRLSPAELDVASDCFRFLVSKSKTKIAHPASDLAEWTRRPEAEVTAVLAALCTAESGRILRRIAPATGDGSASYELFHDILAEPILAWRRQYEERREREAAELRQREMRRRLVLASGVAIALAAVFAGLAVWALVERNNADSQRRQTNELLQVREESNRKLLARIARDTKLANVDAAAADALVEDVGALRKTNSSLTQQTASLKKTNAALTAQNRKLRATNRELVAAIDELNAENAALAKQVNDLDNGYKALQSEDRKLDEDEDTLRFNKSTLTNELGALKQQKTALADDLTRLTAKAAELGLALPVASPVAPALAAPPILDIPATIARRFLVPGDVAGSDALRRQVEALERRLQQLLQKRARLADEKGWLLSVNALLVRQRTALRREHTHLEATHVALERRQSVLRQTRQQAEAEHRRLSSRAAAREARNAKEQKNVQKHRNANEHMADANDQQIAAISDDQLNISELRGRIGEHVTLLQPYVEKLVEGARSSSVDAKVAALLAVDAYRVTPHHPDDPAHPEAYDALWFALKRLDPTATQQLSSGPHAATVKSKLCALAKGPPTAEQLRDLRRYLPSSARPILLRPCG